MRTDGRSPSENIVRCRNTKGPRHRCRCAQTRWERCASVLCRDGGKARFGASGSSGMRWRRMSTSVCAERPKHERAHTEHANVNSWARAWGSGGQREARATLKKRCSRERRSARNIRNGGSPRERRSSSREWGPGGARNSMRGAALGEVNNQTRGTRPGADESLEVERRRTWPWFEPVKIGSS